MVRGDICMKYRLPILIAVAILSGPFGKLIPLSFESYMIVYMWFFTCAFICLVYFLWLDGSIPRQIGLLLCAFLLGYAVEEVVSIPKCGIPNTVDLSAGAMLMGIRILIGTCGLAAVHVGVALLKRVRSKSRRGDKQPVGTSETLAGRSD